MSSQQNSVVSNNVSKPNSNKTLIIVLVILGILLLSCSCCAVLYSIGTSGTANKSSTSSSQDLSQVTGSSLTNTTQTSASTSSANKVGDVVVIDDLQIKVLSVENLGNSITKPYLSPIKTQGKFIKINFEVENIGKDSQYMGNMQIIDSTGRTFDESDQKFSILGDSATFLEKLNPNIKSNYSTVFDVASDAKALKLKTSGFGLFNTNSVLIELGINGS